MMSCATIFQDHRRSYRIPVEGSASVRTASGSMGSFVVDNLSLGGALLVGRTKIEVGEHLRVLIRIAGGPSLWVRGRALRRQSPLSADGPLRVAIQFFDLAPSTEDRIHDLLLRALQNHGRPEALVIEPSATARRRISRHLEELGWSTVTGATPLEALIALEGGREIECALVDEKLGQTQGVDVLRYIAREWPDMRRIAITGKRRTRTMRRLLDEGSVQGALVRPVTGEQISTVVGPARGALWQAPPPIR